MQQEEPVVATVQPQHLTSRLTVSGLILAIVILVVISIGLGMLGYWLIEGLSAADCWMEVNLILWGEGPYAMITTTGGKVFVGFYSMFSGGVFLIIIAIMVTILWRRLTPNQWNR